MAALTSEKVAGRVASGREMVAVGDAHRLVVTSRHRLVAVLCDASDSERIRRAGHGVSFWA